MALRAGWHQQALLVALVVEDVREEDATAPHAQRVEARCTKRRGSRHDTRPSARPAATCTCRRAFDEDLVRVGVEAALSSSCARVGG
jgi:hypothetical protein